mmetsp:Transcript_41840/g.69128  ORF Transcript_41840/g.69128 Transcript_41840/m.69128 type:complete len:87 (-) Transcript_41840:603-863(-)
MIQMLSLKVFCGRMDLFLNQLVCMASQHFENSNWVQTEKCASSDSWDWIGEISEKVWCRRGGNSCSFFGERVKVSATMFKLVNMSS